MSIANQMLLSSYEYYLPEELIAQEPLEQRDQSRLLVLCRDTERIEHRSFFEITEYLRPGDVLVLNDTRVTAVRLKGSKPTTGGKVEALLLRDLGDNRWEAMVKPGRRVDVGATLEFDGGLAADVVGRTPGGGRILDFGDADGIAGAIRASGETPLPPYIHSYLRDANRYQTVYAAMPGSAAAPTAGFHFTPELLSRVRAMGVKTTFVTLHVGIATFRPVRTENLADHEMHTESIAVSREAAEIINTAEGRIIAVGTTTARTLESAAIGDRRVAVVDGETSLFITPGYRFRIVGGLVTNFHIPKSTLLVLVSAMAGRDAIMKAYAEARETGYRFLSFGDAMFIV